MNQKQIIIKTDYREKPERINNLMKFMGYENKHNLKENKNNYFVVEESLLEYGDYLINDEICIEYKTYDDYIKSLQNGRLYRQVYSMRNDTDYDYYYLLVEAPYNKRLDYHSDGYFTHKQLYHSIARFESCISVLLCESEFDCFDMMKTLFIYSSTPFPLKPFKTGSTAYNVLRYSLKGVGPKTAERVVNGLGLDSLQDVLGLERDDLLSVKGIAESKAEMILKQLK